MERLPRETLPRLFQNAKFVPKTQSFVQDMEKLAGFHFSS
jgi:hypothetical protein